MNGFSVKWFGKLVSSLVKLNPQLKIAKNLKKTKDSMIKYLADSK